MKKSRQFYLLIVDDDKEIFNVIGPISSDIDWSKKVVDLRKSGRNIRCFSCNINEPINNIINSYSQQMKYNYSEQLIIYTPEDSSIAYCGILPQYACTADKKRIVKILCPECGTTRFAIMETVYPGQEVLKKSDLGDFTATCLKCGYETNDSYNWYR